MADAINFAKITSPGMYDRGGVPCLPLSDLFHVALAAIRAGVTLFIFGNRGLGKTSLVWALAAYLNYKLVIRHVQNEDPLSCVLISWDDQGNPIQKPVGDYRTLWDATEHTIFCLDDAGQMNRAQQAFTMPICEGRTFAGKPLATDPKTGEPLIHVVATSNWPDEGAGVQKLITTLKGRTITVGAYYWWQDHLKWSAEHNEHPLVQMLIPRYGQEMLGECPDNGLGPDPQPRTLSYLSQVLNSADEHGGLSQRDLRFLNHAVLGPVWGARIAEEWSLLQAVNIDAMLADPMGCAVPDPTTPEGIGKAYAVAALIAMRATPSQMDAAWEILRRIGRKELTGFAIHYATKRDPNCLCGKYIPQYTQTFTPIWSRTS